MADLRTRIGKLELENPAMCASGTFGSGAEFKELVNLDRLGAIIAKTVTLEPRTGNPAPRTAETPAGLLNSIGLPNKGAEHFIKHDLPVMAEYGPPVIVNLAGKTADDYARVAALFAPQEQVSAVEVNVSCPNVSSGGIAFGRDPGETARVTSAVRGEFPRTLIVKLTPSVTDVGEIALAAEWAGADAVTVANTYEGMCVDWRNRRSLIGTPSGGVSGPAIKPLTLAGVWKTYRAVKIPVIGCGGIASADDVLEYAVAGASAVEVGTMNFVDPGIMEKIISGIARLMDDAGLARFTDLVGTFEEN